MNEGRFTAFTSVENTPYPLDSNLGIHNFSNFSASSRVSTSDFLSVSVNRPPMDIRKAKGSSISQQSGLKLVGRNQKGQSN